jgi:hypothetical protein
MAPRLSVSPQAIMNRLNGVMPGSAMQPSNSIIDQMLASYATGAAIPDPVLDGNETTTDPLQEYLNAGQIPTNTTAPPPVANSSGGIPNWDAQGLPPRDPNFQPYGIANDDNWHNLGGSVMEHQLNSNVNPRDVALFWARNNGEHLRNAEPYGADGRFTVSYNYPNLEAYKKDAAKTSQLPPQAYSGNGSGYVGGDSGGSNGNISQGTYAPPSMPATATGSYGDTSGLLNQYANSAPKPPTSSVSVGAIQNRLSKMRGGR